MIKRYLVFGLITGIWVTFCPPQAAAQNDTTQRWQRLLDRILHEDRPPDRPRLMVYPTFAFAPETNLEIGAAAALLFHAKNDMVHNRLSEATAFAFFTLRNQYGLWLEHVIYTDKDLWLLIGRERFQRFPLLYYGVGPETGPEMPDVVDGLGLLVRERAFRLVRENLFFGPQIDYQSLSRIQFGDPDVVSGRPLPPGANGSNNFAVGLGVAYDSRINALNARNGWFAELGWLHYSPALGSDFAFEQYYTDLRWFKSWRTNQVFATQITANIVSGTAPFNQMSLLGSETMMRGYYTGRYRDRHFYAAQAEYRWLPLPFFRRIGATTFFSLGTVADRWSSLATQDVRWAAGAGLRYLLFPKKDIFLRFDLGFTREGSGFYIFTGEAF
jgi:hypothetical protein